MKTDAEILATAMLHERVPPGVNEPAASFIRRDIEASRKKGIASARIVTPEEAAQGRTELACMKILIGLARMAGVPAHVVQFSDGIAALVPGDPNDTEVWNNALTQIHKAATTGQIGPIGATDPS